MMRPWPEIHRIAAVEARRAHRDLGLDVSRRIDPFAALETAGVVVMRQRLDHLAGLYLPGDPADGSTPGVLINSAHPLSKQRFTAAHELCHHLRDRQAVFDEETEWAARDGSPATERERLAEAFAAWFLMPKPLVDRTLVSLGLRAEELEGEGAYALALALGTSYAATVRHLSDMRLIGAAHRDRLLRITPQAIKQALGALDVVADAWKNVWLIRTPPPDLAVGAIEGDAVVVEVPETPSSGYIWQPVLPDDGLALVRDEYRAPDGQALGGRGRHRFLFRADAAGRRRVRLEMRRPWQRGDAAETFNIEVTVEPSPAAGMVRTSQLVPAA